MSGFFGCVSKKECVADVFYGTDYHSHLGTRRGGMSFYKENQFVRSIHSLENAYFRTKFEADLYRFQGAKMGLGVISDTESQPITMTSHLGKFSIVTVARIDNIEQLTQELIERKINFAEMSGSEINATELIAILISLGDTFKQGIELVQQKVKGSCSMLIMTQEGIYASRDKLGRTPVILGQNEDGYTVAAESSALTNLEYQPVRELGPAETVLITAEGITQITPKKDKLQICAFLWVYYGYPSSFYEDINVEIARYECGCALSKRDDKIAKRENKDSGVDFVAGIPDSGIGHAVGYSNCKGIPYKRAFVKYTPTWPRSFTPSDQRVRSLVAKMKLLPNSALIKNSNMVLLDDSIVRGTQLKDNVVKLVEAGGGEMHVRLACPPLIYPCKFINFSSSRSNLELVTRRMIDIVEGTPTPPDHILAEYADHTSPRYAKMVEMMRESIGVTSLRFQRMDDMVEAIGLPKEKLCTHCWDGSSYF